jgi:hypothetical protein
MKKLLAVLGALALVLMLVGPAVASTDPELVPVAFGLPFWVLWILFFGTIGFLVNAKFKRR